MPLILFINISLLILVIYPLLLIWFMIILVIFSKPISILTFLGFSLILISFICFVIILLLLFKVGFLFFLNFSFVIHICQFSLDFKVGLIALYFISYLLNSYLLKMKSPLLILMSYSMCLYSIGLESNQLDILFRLLLFMFVLKLLIQGFKVFNSFM